MARRALLRAVAAALLAAVPVLSAAQSSYEQFLKAVNQGDVKTVEGYLNLGLDPDTADLEGNTILMIAARLGHADLVALLINRKAGVNKRSPHGDTALMMASLKGHLGVAQLLATYGAEINHPGWTPLHYAAFEGRAEVVKFLLEKGADKNALAPNGYSPLMLAVRGNHLEAARALLYEDPDLMVKGPKGETALALAKAGNFKDLEDLLRRAGAY